LQVDVVTVESEHLPRTECAPDGEHDGCPVLLGHRLGERGHLVDVGDSAIGHAVSPAALDPAWVLDDQVVEDGGVKDGFEQPVGGACGPGRPGGDIGVPGADVDRRDLRQLRRPEGGLWPVLE
jgi:hypothetical protein